MSVWPWNVYTCLFHFAFKLCACVCVCAGKCIHGTCSIRSHTEFIIALGALKSHSFFIREWQAIKAALLNDTNRLLYSSVFLFLCVEECISRQLSYKHTFFSALDLNFASKSVQVCPWCDYIKCADHTLTQQTSHWLTRWCAEKTLIQLIRLMFDTKRAYWQPPPQPQSRKRSVRNRRS